MTPKKPLSMRYIRAVFLPNSQIIDLAPPLVERLSQNL
jgi:hypothetical protein